MWCPNRGLADGPAGVPVCVPAVFLLVSPAMAPNDPAVVSTPDGYLSPNLLFTRNVVVKVHEHTNVHMESTPTTMTLDSMRHTCLQVP